MALSVQLSVSFLPVECKKMLDKSNSLSIQMMMSNASTESYSMECPPVAIEVENGEPPISKVSAVSAVLLSLALSLHSVLEGAALGAQTTTSAHRNIMIAILAHKGLSSYALGASLVGSQMQRTQFWALGLCFSLASPLGIMTGEQSVRLILNY